MCKQFAGYRRVLNYGWIPQLSFDDYEQDDAWEYYDFDVNDMIMVAYNRDTDSFAWVKGVDTDEP